LKVSIVIPVYKSQNIVSKTVKKIIEVQRDQSYDYEIVLVNDGSPDNSWKVINTLSQEYEHITAINLLKNYGQHSAVLCGFKYCEGDYIVTMDDDLQNPPSEIQKLVDKIEEGFDLVFANFEDKKHASYRRIGSKIIGYINFKIFDKPADIVLTNFRIVRRDVIERVLKHRTIYPYIPGLLLKYSNNIANTETKHLERPSGESNYNLIKIAKLVARLLFAYSSYPLKLLTQIGFAISLFSFCAGLYFMFNKVVSGVTVPGWTTVVVLLSFLNGFVIIMLGVLGEFVVRIVQQMSNEPTFIVETVNGEKD